MSRSSGIALDTQGMPRALRRRLERAAAKARSVEELRLRLSPQDQEALERALLGAAPEPPARPEPSGAFPGLSDPDRARRWIRARCPVGALESKIWIALGSRVCAEHGIYGNLTMDDLIPRYRQYGPGTADAIERWAKALAAEHTKTLARHARAEAWRSVPPPDPLRDAWRQLRSVQGELLHQLGGPRAAVHARDAHVDDRELALVVPGLVHLSFGTPAELRIGHRGPDLLCGVEAALDVLTSPDCRAVRERLQLLLEQSPAVRTLERLARASARRALPADDDKRQLGWEWVDDEGAFWLCPVQCRPTKAGTFVSRRLTRVDPRSELFEDPAEARLLSLCGEREPEVLAAALRLLAGHPRVFASAHSRKRSLRVREARLQLGVRRADDGVVVRLELDRAPVPRDMFHSQVEGLLALVSERELVFAEYDLSLLPWLDELGQAELRLHDERELEALRELLGGLARALPVDIDPHVLGRPMAADPRPGVACRWQDGALDVVVRVAAAPDVASQPPGRGPAVLLAKRGDEVRSIHRDLDREPARIRAWLDELPELELPRDAEIAPFHWSISDVQQALPVMEGLRAHRERLQLVWEGQPPMPPTAVTAQSLRLRIGSGTDWFGLSGSARIGRTDVELDLLLDAASRGHRFVSVGKDRWVKIEAALREQLEALQSVRENGQLGIVQGAVIDDLSALGATLEADEGWQERRAAANRAATLQVPIPHGLHAELRPYQQEGFRWLARLASWAPGACLADDMGLGKTVQSLCLLLHRAHEGPALVVCPTSVVDNWVAEAARFTPGLHVAAYRGPKRAGLLQDSERPQVLVTSYGLMTRDAERLSQVPWGTLVLDEAQAIRNPAAQRTRAARSLPAGFRVALSGTPIQNRTSELWSVLSFAVPGLLGSLPHFHKAFAVPIDVHQDAARRDLLARLVSPFVLRRTKDRVARELPDKTEQVIRVSLSDEERALYDAERRAAVRRLQQAGSKRGFRMLQELTRLRQLACHPRLVDASSEVDSSKLRRIVATLVQLRAAGHAALVFSSFTSHLGLLRQALEDRGFLLRYLDGSTPPGRRSDEIAAFQAGDGDAFLISLKAGGTGLNLTRATYVLHLDPWWNPAAEDQATDRAHRIGQTDPVTVYRFVSEGTIEEQIVSLHGRKRELASALLGRSGSDEIPDTDTLMDLLRQGREAASMSPAPRPEAPEPRGLPPSVSPSVSPSVPPPPEPPRASTPAPPAPSTVELVEAFRIFLEQSMKPSSAAAYARCAGHALADAAERGLAPEQGVVDYAQRAAEGEGRTRSCTRLARPMARKLVPWLQSRRA